MGVKSFLLDQLSKPSGWFAPITARLLNKGNDRQNKDCIDALGLTRDCHVLDVGFGGAVSFARLLQDCPDGQVAGTEVSREMLARAEGQWAREIAQGRLQIAQCGAERMDFEEGRFHRVMTVNTLYFWPDVGAGMNEVRRVLTAGGRFVASVVAAENLKKMGFADMGFRTETPAFYARELEAAGYLDVCCTATGDRKGSVLVSGCKPAARS